MNQDCYFDTFHLSMPREAIEDMSASGSNDDAVEYWHGELDLCHIPDDAIRNELLETGAWTEEDLQDREENERRLLWIAAHNAKEANQ